MGPLPISLRTKLAIGIDFGTTNSSVAYVIGADPDGPQGAKAPEIVRLIEFPGADQATSTSSRSILYLEQTRQQAHSSVASFTGASAIHRYLNRNHAGDVSSGFEAPPGRLIQSLKSYLAVPTLTGTEIFGRRYTVEDLIARILTDLRLVAERQVGQGLGVDATIVVGRPVHFVSANTVADDHFAVTRLRSSLASAALPDVNFLPEPVAAALAYESTLDRDELVLIGDFGGGTSDFSLVRVGPSARTLPPSERIVGTAGLGLAGDAIDAKLVRHLVSPALGSDSLARPRSKNLPAVPAWIYANLERWHYLSFLRTRNVDEILRTARLRALEPGKIDALITLIDEDLGYQLHQAVGRTKIALSTTEHTEFLFNESGLDLRIPLSRSTFESWISAEISAIEATVDGLFTATRIAPNQVDRVFLTGGTSFVPAIRRIFENRFTPARVTIGEAFTSVARGLALHALHLLSA